MVVVWLVWASFCVLCTIVYISLISGIVVRKKIFISNKHQYEVRDELYVLSPKKNTRGIYLANTDIIISIIYLNDPTRWAYYDMIKDTFIQSRTHPKNILILGGGGGSVARTFLQDYPNCKVTIVESSESMIEISKLFFLANFTHQENLNIYHGDATNYLSKCDKFNTIFVDIHNEFRLDSVVYTRSFLTELKKRLDSDGVMIINYGRGHLVNKQMLSSSLYNVFPSAKIYQSGMSILAVFGITPTTLGYPWTKNSTR